MKRAIVTPAAAPPSALAELKDWLGTTNAGDDLQLISLLRAAMELCEEFTGTMPLQQVCEDMLPVTAGWQALSARPVQVITGLSGIPAGGAAFSLPASAYAVDLDSDGGGAVRVISPGEAGRVTVRYVAGLAADWTVLADGLRHGILRLAAHQYRAREDRGGETAMPPAVVAALWRPWRRMRLT